MIVGENRTLSACAVTSQVTEDGACLRLSCLGRLPARNSPDRRVSAPRAPFPVSRRAARQSRSLIDSKSAPPAVYIPAWTILRLLRCSHHVPLPSCLRSARHWTSGSGALLVSTRGVSERNGHLNRSVHLVSTSNGVSCLGDTSHSCVYTVCLHV